MKKIMISGVFSFVTIVIKHTQIIDFFVIVVFLNFTIVSQKTMNQLLFTNSRGLYYLNSFKYRGDPIVIMWKPRW